jgi:purine-binding chemotaxis protein CheW
MDMPSNHPGSWRFCTFYLDGLLFGIPVEKVQEVIRYQEMTRVPLAPPVIRGLINLRGQIVLAIDLRRRLELTEAPPGLLPMNIVLGTPDGPISFLADEIGGVIEVGDEAFSPPPDTLRGTARELILGAFKLKERLLLLLDAERAAAVETLERAVP